MNSPPYTLHVGWCRYVLGFFATITFIFYRNQKKFLKKFWYHFKGLSECHMSAQFERFTYFLSGDTTIWRLEPEDARMEAAPRYKVYGEMLFKDPFF